MRFAATSACTSSSNFMSQVAPRASLTVILGLVPVLSSSTNVNGPCGARASAPEPQNRSSEPIGPGARQRTAGTDASAGAAGFRAPPDEAHPAATTDRTSQKLRRVLIALPFKD